MELRMHAGLLACPPDENTFDLWGRHECGYDGLEGLEVGDEMKEIESCILWGYNQGFSRAFYSGHVICPGGVSQRSQIELNSKLDLNIIENH